MTDSIKRVRYFDRQFLHEDDFQVEQAYHREQRRLHNRTLHTWGIAEGLELTFRQGGDAITVGAGVAFDAEGREIVIAEDLLQDVSAFGGQTAWVTVRYDEEEAEPSSETEVTGNTRVFETPRVAVSPDPPEEPGTTLVLGRVTVEMGDDGPVVGSLDDGEGSLRRRRAGISAGEALDVEKLALTDPEIDASRWARLELEAPDQAKLTGGLRVTGDLALGEGSDGKQLAVGRDSIAARDANATTPLLLQQEGGGLSIHGGTDEGRQLTLTDEGHLGLGTTPSEARLTVAGEIQADFYRAGQGAEGTVEANQWYRIALNTSTGKRASADFTLRDRITAGGHSTLALRVGSSYNNAPGMSVTVFGHSRYKLTTFAKVRVLRKDTYDPQYLDVFVERSGAVSFSIYDNLQVDGWQPVAWEIAEIPEGYSAHEFDVDQLFMVGDEANRFNVGRGGNVGIGTSSPQARLHVAGSSDAELGTAGLVVLGTTDGKNLTLDNNEIMARNSGIASPLYLQASGGGLHANHKCPDIHRFVLTEDGEVGIGTPSPSAKLDVRGDTTIDGGLEASGPFRLAGKAPIELKRFHLNTQRNLDTGYSDSEYSAVVVGFSALNGDIQENDRGDIIKVYMYQDSGRWWIRVDFRTHNSSEDWWVDGMFLRKELVVQHGTWAKYD